MSHFAPLHEIWKIQIQYFFCMPLMFDTHLSRNFVEIIYMQRILPINFEVVELNLCLQKLNNRKRWSIFTISITGICHLNWKYQNENIWNEYSLWHYIVFGSVCSSEHWKVQIQYYWCMPLTFVTHPRKVCIVGLYEKHIYCEFWN